MPRLPLEQERFGMATAIFRWGRRGLCLYPVTTSVWMERMPFMPLHMQIRGIILWGACSALHPVISGGMKRFSEQKITPENRKASGVWERIRCFIFPI